VICGGSSGHDAPIAAGRAEKLADLDPKNSCFSVKPEIGLLARDFPDGYRNSGQAGGGQRPRFDDFLRFVESRHWKPR